ncbi:guanine deaminase [Dongia sp.]|uniref:guanine deaminase n=1 Tax=Dongia sp. TaxID=1977262 RepID=UPI0035B07150
MQRLIRGTILHFLGDPGTEPAPASWQLFADGALLVEDGLVRRVGEAAALLADAPEGTEITDCRGKLILPGFVDTHVHSAQLDVIASYGTQLLDWLTKYTFPAERLFKDEAHGERMAGLFLDRLLASGTTTAAVYPTVHKQSVDTFFAAAAARKLRMLAGKVLMDRNCPDYLRDDVAGAEADCRDLIARWHGKGRLGYALTPRFAPTSSPQQLAMAGRLFQEIPGLHLQSHLAENLDEIKWVHELFPAQRSYLDVYDHFGLLGPRAIYGHCIHTDATDRVRMAATRTAIAFCPSSNLFIGSGLFDLDQARNAGIRVGLASDVGGGTSLSMLEVMADAYKVLQLKGQHLNPWRAFYLATLGGAEALSLEDRIGNFAVGKEADFTVLDFDAIPILKHRSGIARDFAERLFALMILGDDRAVAATYVLGELAYRRP